MSHNPFLRSIAVDLPGAGLGARLAAKLLDKIAKEELAPGQRLPSESVLASTFGVSRTVVREAIMLLRARDVLDTRKGSGTYVRSAVRSESPRRRADAPGPSLQSVFNLIEVRRVVEAETAALAAVRRTPGQLAEIEHALRRLRESVASGGDGVAEDAYFHQCIATAAGNPYWQHFAEVFADEIHSSLKVTRSREMFREGMAQNVIAEHSKIVSAIEAGDAKAAREAAMAHMDCTAARIREAAAAQPGAGG